MKKDSGTLSLLAKIALGIATILIVLKGWRFSDALRRTPYRDAYLFNDVLATLMRDPLLNWAIVSVLVFSVVSFVWAVQRNDV